MLLHLKQQQKMETKYYISNFSYDSENDAIEYIVKYVMCDLKPNNELYPVIVKIEFEPKKFRLSVRYWTLEQFGEGFSENLDKTNYYYICKYDYKLSGIVSSQNKTEETEETKTPIIYWTDKNLVDYAGESLRELVTKELSKISVGEEVYLIVDEKMAFSITSQLVLFFDNVNFKFYIPSPKMPNYCWKIVELNNEKNVFTSKVYCISISWNII